jgi:sulfur relay (sulfurtransferase) DsrF/TusC family protein
MSDKKFGILIRNSPYQNIKVVEAMRLGVGLTIRDIQVYLFFLEDGLIALREESIDSEDEPLFIKHLKTLVELGQTLVAESESKTKSENFYKALAPELWNRGNIFSFLTQCDGVVFV